MYHGLILISLGHLKLLEGSPTTSVTAVDKFDHKVLYEVKTWDTSSLKFV